MSFLGLEEPDENLVCEGELKSLLERWVAPSPQKLSISESQTVIIGRWEAQPRRQLRQSPPTANTR